MAAGSELTPSSVELLSDDDDEEEESDGGDEARDDVDWAGSASTLARRADPTGSAVALVVVGLPWSMSTR